MIASSRQETISLPAESACKLIKILRDTNEFPLSNAHSIDL